MTEETSRTAEKSPMADMKQPHLKKEKDFKQPHLKEEKDYTKYKELFQHHINSFNYMTEEGLRTMLANIKPVEVLSPTSKLTISFEYDKIYHPAKVGPGGIRTESLYPVECREAKISYLGNFWVEVKLQYDDGDILTRNLSLGKIPIMLKSKLCNLLEKFAAKALKREEPSDMGGYFILDGVERVFRPVLLPKQNYPMSMVRKSFLERKKSYSDKAVVMRCVRADQSAVTVTLKYLTNGSARLVIRIRGSEHALPVGIILKALTEKTDHEIYKSLACCYRDTHGQGKGFVGTQLNDERAKIVLDEVRDLSLYTRYQCVEHIGKVFHPVMVGLGLGQEKQSYSVVAKAVLRDYIFVHLKNNSDKFNLLIVMLLKLFSLVDQTSEPDNPNLLQHQEVLLPGHLITIYLKEKIQNLLLRVKKRLQDKVDKEEEGFILSNWQHVMKVIEQTNPKQMGSDVEYMLKTGILNLRSDLDLSERAGMTIVANRSSFLRFISHFRAVHRGASFVGLPDTSVKKLSPESWGFLCCVHTPNGEQCGLLNHMTSVCRLTSNYDSKGKVKDFLKLRLSISKFLVQLGMTQASHRLLHGGPPKVLYVLLDGHVVGSIASDIIEEAVRQLRMSKVLENTEIPEDLEVGYVPLSQRGAYPGLYLFTASSRFIRPVRNILIPSKDELIGPFEQVYMEISCPDGGNGGRRDASTATHTEIHPTGILGVIANLTPWSDHIASVQHMYQCQMAKQTMGFSCHTLSSRADQKLYHLQTPQTPIVRTKAYEEYNIDDYPQGTNAIVAVLSYSGYDMGSGITFNKSSVERGMFHGCIYETETVDLTKQKIKSFGKSKVDEASHLIGLPLVGQKISSNKPYYSIYDANTSRSSTTMFKGSTHAYADYVAVDGNNNHHKIQKANIRLRHPRDPIVGDSFSTRHGQKGLCTVFLQDVDMPFSEITGMRPDIIINPHSSTAVAMLLELTAGKGGALKGKFVDATPFSKLTETEESDNDPASLVDELGSTLCECGFNYYGKEVLYSGNYGTEMTCEILMGPVYYQRLRHMALDKSQVVRSTGTVDRITRQPIQPAIHFGEMERDSLLAHGAAYLLHDRLHSTCDLYVADVCTLCRSILTASVRFNRDVEAVRKDLDLPPGRSKKKICVSCQTSKGMETVAIPYVFRYLAVELAVLGIRLEINVKGPE